MKEKELLHGAKQLEHDALADIYDQYSPGIFRYAMRLTGNEHMAEECVSDTFTRFLNSLHNQGGPQDHLQAYLYRIAHNWITDTFRSSTPPEVPLQEEMREDNPEILQIIQQNQQRNKVRKALYELTPEQRQVIVLKYLEGWKNSEISVAMQKPIGAIKALQHRAMEALRKFLITKEDT